MHLLHSGNDKLCVVQLQHRRDIAAIEMNMNGGKQMAFYNDISNPSLSLVERASAALSHAASALYQRAAKRRMYRTTLTELSNLSTRDLNDLGIARSDIRRIAFETAYGQHA